MTKTLAPLLCLATLAFAAGCGGDDGDSGSLADAKQALVDDCHEGHEGDDKDLALCRCIADQLATEHGYDTAEKFEDARKSVADGDVPPEVQKAASSPACQKTQ